MRERTYSEWVRDGRMKQEDADREITTMRAILADYPAPPAQELDLEPFTFADQVAVSQNLQALAEYLDGRFRTITGGKPVAFSLFTWSGHRSQYVSNAARDDIRKGMLETLERWDQDEGPPHKMA